MKSKWTRFAGGQVAQQVLRGNSGIGRALDLRFGMQLLRDRRIPILTKLFALGLGMALTWALVALETPLEAILAVFVPVGGMVMDAVVDGAEVVICPFLFAALMLPHLAARPLVEAARNEHLQLIPATTR